MSVCPLVYTYVYLGSSDLANQIICFLLRSINMDDRYLGALAVLVQSGWINIVLSHGVIFTIGISERGVKNVLLYLSS